jgi:tRNA nucleotidyltransferase (CCA-adding enzyme)
MKIYLVGGAVRDKLLGMPIKERDYVVVGGTVPEMLALGYRQVGKEFPVFLHPKTGEEYALARKERKVKPGYTGFIFETSPDVSLEADLSRRDLTINAMAETLNGELVDPYHGREDLNNKILRHISEAFLEDPVRILRVGRFLARYAHLGFDVAKETYTLMKKMVAKGEVDALIAERVWKELERALSEKNPEQFFAVLNECGALPILFPHLQMGGPGIKALVAATPLTESPMIRFAALLYAQPEINKQGIDPKMAITELCNRYRVPNNYRELALLTGPNFETVLSAKELSSNELLKLFTTLDIFRREKRFHDFLIAIAAIAATKNIKFDQKWLAEAAKIAKSVNIQEIIVTKPEGKELADKIKEKRKEALERWFHHPRESGDL